MMCFMLYISHIPLSPYIIALIQPSIQDNLPVSHYDYIRKARCAYWHRERCQCFKYQGHQREGLVTETGLPSFTTTHVTLFTLVFGSQQCGKCPSRRNDDRHQDVYVLSVFILIPGLIGRYIAGNQYLTGLTLYFIGYVLFEIPCNVSNAY